VLATVKVEAKGAELEETGTFAHAHKVRTAALPPRRQG
jgi:hypothetical protein